ncbi:M15 family metallopeptidase [Psychrobium sp. MM17-31]|uniref:M15 family metallopeptidase n=1 Tax=Psychrobium sp. MM17-31 TaxID=2917758 RepID=UPI001EF653C4|nr:M15 family metallopeptidase [Psychrobium sp. MM17-31]MCG7532298.1 M15 family metallopeptidase [Psychrobium sp. MM17-31]
MKWLTLLFTLWITLFAGQATAKSAVSPLTTNDCKTLQQSAVITANNPVNCQRLRRVTFDFIGFDGNGHRGQVTVLDIAAQQTAKLFKTLLKAGFALEQAQSMANYGGDDQRSMAQNNTSAFNGRAITNGKRWSLHAYGAAIDINPVQNPFVDIAKDGAVVVSPTEGARQFLNRLNVRPSKPQRQGMAEDVVDVFALHGYFIWGGDWNYPIDYQHFQLGPRRYVETLAKLSPQQAAELFNNNVNRFKQCWQQHQKLDKSQRRQTCIELILPQLKRK